MISGKGGPEYLRVSGYKRAVQKANIKPFIQLEKDFNEDKVFIDISNIEKKDNLIYFWDMLSHKEYNDTHKYWSVTAYIEANCDEFWYRKLNLLMDLNGLLQFINIVRKML